MSRINKALTVFMVSVLGVWGCAKASPNSTAQTERIQALETKCTRLEDDYRTTAVARDQARKQASGLEQEKTQLEEQREQMQKEIDQLKLVVKERDRLRQEVEARTTQRDALQVRCDKIKAGLRNLMSEDDAMLNLPPTVNTAVSTNGTR